jgi:two-component system chemotaxis response regulator CheY
MFITAEAEMSQVMEAIKSGTSNYITKPFTPATLKEKLTAVYNSTRPKQA